MYDYSVWFGVVVGAGDKTKTTYTQVRTKTNGEQTFYCVPCLEFPTRVYHSPHHKIKPKLDGGTNAVFIRIEVPSQIEAQYLLGRK